MPPLRQWRTDTQVARTYLSACLRCGYTPESATEYFLYALRSIRNPVTVLHLFAKKGYLLNHLKGL